MSEQTVPAREALSRSGDGRACGRGERISGWLHSGRWLLAALGLLLVSTLVVLWAKSRPGYDPYGWLVWGHLTLHGKLETDGAPSWKPLPYLFTLPYALLGRPALWLWMITSVAVSLSGVVFAWRVAFGLVDAPAQRRYAAYAAGLVAGLSVLGIDDFLHSILSVESDSMIVALCLAAADCIICRRYRWAFWVWWLAALGRPEVWAPMGLYVLWAWRSVPAMRGQMIAGVLLIPLLWFGIPGLTSKSPFSAATLAERSPRALHGNKLTGTVDRFLALDVASIEVAALIATGLAVLRRQKPVLLLAGGVLLWVAVEVGFALHGWSAVPRYLFEAGAGVCVLAGVFVGRVILDLGTLLHRLRVGVPPRVSGSAAVAVIAIFALTLAPTAQSRLSVEQRDLRGQRARAREIDLLSEVVTKLGPARILHCGQPNISLQWQSILAWYLGTNTGVLHFSPRHERRHPHPVVEFYAHSYGWQVFPSQAHNRTQAARCRGLRLRLRT